VRLALEFTSRLLYALPRTPNLAKTPCKLASDKAVTSAFLQRARTVSFLASDSRLFVEVDNEEAVGARCDDKA